jgi:hypothetical protein
MPGHSNNLYADQIIQGKRRFYIIAVVVLSVVGATTALSSLILHYTEKGSNEFGCNSERLMMAGKLNTNQFCTREMAACNFQSRYLTGSKKSLAGIACNEAVSCHQTYSMKKTNDPPGGGQVASDTVDCQLSHCLGDVLVPGKNPSNYTRHSHSQRP